MIYFISMHPAAVQLWGENRNSISSSFITSVCKHHITVGSCTWAVLIKHWGQWQRSTGYISIYLFNISLIYTLNNITTFMLPHQRPSLHCYYSIMLEKRWQLACPPRHHTYVTRDQHWSQYYWLLQSYLTREWMLCLSFPLTTKARRCWVLVGVFVHDSVYVKDK